MAAPSEKGFTMSRKSKLKHRVTHYKGWSEEGPDVRFFDRYPDRSFRVRRTFPGEIDAICEANGVRASDLVALPPGQVFGVIVRQFVRGALTRLPIAISRSSQLDLMTDRECELWYLIAISQHPVAQELERRYRAWRAVR